MQNGTEHETARRDPFGPHSLLNCPAPADLRSGLLATAVARRQARHRRRR